MRADHVKDDGLDGLALRHDAQSSQVSRKVAEGWMQTCFSFDSIAHEYGSDPRPDVVPVDAIRVTALVPAASRLAHQALPPDPLPDALPDPGPPRPAPVLDVPLDALDDRVLFHPPVLDPLGQLVVGFGQRGDGPATDVEVVVEGIGERRERVDLPQRGGRAEGVRRRRGVEQSEVVDVRDLAPSKLCRPDGVSGWKRRERRADGPLTAATKPLVRGNRRFFSTGLPFSPENFWLCRPVVASATRLVSTGREGRTRASFLSVLRVPSRKVTSQTFFPFGSGRFRSRNASRVDAASLSQSRLTMTMPINCAHPSRQFWR